MIFGFILIVALGVILVQLGNYSVWVTIFSIALKVAGTVIALLLALLAWTRLYKESDIQ